MHPNNSGLQKDQITTYFIPAHYIETVEVKNKAGNKIFMVKGDISFSENPSFDFAYTPTEKDDVLSVKVVTHTKTYTNLSGRLHWPDRLVLLPVI